MTRRRGGRGRGGGGPAAGRAGVPGRGEAGTGRGGPWLVLGGLGVSPQPEGGGLPACSGQSCTAPPPRTATPPLWVVFRRGRFVFRGTVGPYGHTAETTASPGTAAPRRPDGKLRCRRSQALRLGEAARRFVAQLWLLTTPEPTRAGGRPPPCFTRNTGDGVSSAALTRATGITQSAAQKARGHKYPGDSCKSSPDGFTCFGV